MKVVSSLLLFTLSNIVFTHKIILYGIIM